MGLYEDLIKLRQGGTGNFLSGFERNLKLANRSWERPAKKQRKTVTARDIIAGQTGSTRPLMEALREAQEANKFRLFPNAQRPANVGKFPGSGLIENILNAPRTVDMGVQRIRKGDVKGGVGQSLVGLLDLFSLVPGGAVASNVAKGAIRQGIKRGALYGGGYAGTYGGGSAASSGANNKQILSSILKSGGVGAAVGGAAGGIGGAVGRAAGFPKTPVMPASAPPKVPKTKFRTDAIMPVSTVFKRQGAAGEEIASRLSKWRDAYQIGQSQFLSKIPTVTKLKRSEFKEFVGGLDTLSKGKKIDLSPKVRQAVREWSENIPKIRERAVKAGVDVGDLGPYYFPRNYSQLLKTEKGFNKAAEALVKSGQAVDKLEASRMLNQMKRKYSTSFGHFENARKADLPDYDKDPDAILNYLEGAYRRIAHAEVFGPKGEKAGQLLKELDTQRPFLSKRNLDYFRAATGERVFDRPELLEKSLGAARGVMTITKLGTASVANIQQSVNTLSASTLRDTVKGFYKTFSKSERNFLVDTGAISDIQVRNLRNQYSFLRGKLSRYAMPLFAEVEKMNRSVAALAGRSYGQRLAQSGNIQRLREIGVEGPIGKTLTYRQQVQASRGLVEKTQFLTDPQDLPFLASTPEGKMVMQFRSFIYRQTGFMWNEILKKFGKGDVTPLIKFVAAGIPAGYGAGKVRATLKGQEGGISLKGTSEDREQPGLAETALDAFANVGGLGMGLGDAYFLNKVSDSPRLPQYIAGTLGGPTVGEAGKTLINLYEASGGNADPIKRQGLSTIPVAGPYLSSKLVPFKTSSAMTRQALGDVGDDIFKELKSINYRPSIPAREQRNQELSDEQYEEFKKRSAELFASKVRNAMKDNYYQGLAVEEKKKVLMSQLYDSRNTIRNMMFGKPNFQRSYTPKY